jgi:hypothetical protein
MKSSIRWARVCARVTFGTLADGWKTRALAQSLDPQPEHRGRLALPTFPLVDDRFARRSHVRGELRLAEAEPVPQAHQCRRVIPRHRHTADRDKTPSAASVGSSIPRRHKACAGLSCRRRGERPEIRSRIERHGEAPVMSGGAQGSHVYVELVGKDVKGDPIMRRPCRGEGLRAAYHVRRCRPSARIPRAERLEGDPKRRRAFRLGQVKPYSNRPQGRGAWGHRSRRCHWSPTTGSEWTAMRIRRRDCLEKWPEFAKSISVGQVPTGRGEKRYWRRIPRTRSASSKNLARNGAPGWTRTSDPRLRRPVLYPG